MHGTCNTLGIELLLASQAAVAAEDARFAQLEVARGIFPLGGATFRLPMRLGSTGMRYLLTAERFDAETALRIGLVHELADDLDATVDRFVAELLKSGPQATRAAKRLVREPMTDGEELARIAAGLRAGEEGQEGLRAFLEKRLPSWQ